MEHQDLGCSSLTVGAQIRLIGVAMSEDAVHYVECPGCKQLWAIDVVIDRAKGHQDFEMKCKTCQQLLGFFSSAAPPGSYRLKKIPAHKKRRR